MKRFFSVAIATVLLSGLSTPSRAIEPSLHQLQAELDQAICSQNWSAAIVRIDALMNRDISGIYRKSLEVTRLQVASFHQDGIQFVDGMDCGQITTEDWEQALASVSETPRLPSSTPSTAPQVRVAANTEPPMAGSVCNDFATQQEANYHVAFGTAPLALDDDNDGTACEVLTLDDRNDGHSIFQNTFTTGYNYRIISVQNTEFYLRVAGNGWAFTTRSFGSSDEAAAHAACYYGNDCSRML